MISAAEIREHMEVVGSDGKHVGRVDHIKGDSIELAKLDLATMGRPRLEVCEHAAVGDAGFLGHVLGGGGGDAERPERPSRGVQNACPHLEPARLSERCSDHR